VDWFGFPTSVNVQLDLLIRYSWFAQAIS